MIKTCGGKTIYLDNDFSEKGRAGISGALNFCWILFAPFLMVPIQLVFKDFLAGHFFLNMSLSWWLFYVMVIICIGCVLFLRIAFFKIRHPMAYHWGQMVFGCFRVFYISSILWLVLSSVGWWAYIVVGVLWAFSEVTNRYEVRRIGNEEIYRVFRKRFKIHPEGYVLYDPLVNIKNFLSSTDRPEWVAWRDRFENFGAVMIMLAGPVLFIRSHQYGDNFEPRFLILAAVALALAMATRSMTTDVIIAQRALKLKQQEGLAG
ncbi:hypothetical protein EKK97_10260 [Billgrantia tianxiuensis]|jgi:branched-subunit amino acid transport protein|uniref:Uncharacterized protein n=1 Tax=Billgrantia tianxiuensis TaxID=2497861 RepID=A0A6I6SMY9_9GAMM|nr:MULTISPECIES: hypothetical protein [Halomonas]MCE8032044.1 hypothetical protein [Halomonas sp. MCCC 1A11057]QHC49916.1 hypothetical protein EKK97_10260 [Halomonas tianxiuensis]